MTTTPPDVDLAHHGDAEVAAGLLDCAVNVRQGTPPPWLREVLARAVDDVARYPHQSVAIAAVAERHRRPADEVLLTAGAAEAFVLVARGLAPRRAVVVHPQFTEPEAALRAAGRPVDRLVLDVADGFRLDPATVPDDADLVVIGNPTNPTGVLHPAAGIAALARPGRVLVVDEAFIDFVPGERESLAARRDLPGLVVIRSLTKMWGLAGLRVGYAVGDSGVLARLRAAQPLWPVSTPALAAVVATTTERARAQADRAAAETAYERERLTAALRGLPGVLVVEPAAANFVLVRAAADTHARLRERGIAVRRGDTFPGLGGAWVRIAVRDEAATTRIVEAWPAPSDGDRAPVPARHADQREERV